MALLLATTLATGCGEKKPRGISSISGPPPKVHGVLRSPDGKWELTVLERHPTDPDLHGTTWQVWLGPAGQPVDSTHCSFDAQDLVPTPSWRGSDTVDVVVTGPPARLADIPASYHTMETVLGRDGMRHSFPFYIVAR